MASMPLMGQGLMWTSRLECAGDWIPKADVECLGKLAVSISVNLGLLAAVSWLNNQPSPPS